MKNYKNYILITVILVAIGLIIYFIGRKKSSIEQADLPEENKDITEADTIIIRNLSQRLHEDMRGLNFWGRDKEVYKSLLGLSNSMFVSVYNDFNTLYGKDNKGTLRKWIEDEYFFNLSGLSLEFKTLKNAILERMNKLNLK